MIQNNRQFNVTKGQISKLDSALALTRQAKGKMDTRIYRAMIAGIESQIDELREQLLEFEELKAARALSLQSVTDLPSILVKARVALGYTQKDLANKLNLSPQQIQKYEATGYRSASLSRVLKIMGALHLDFETEIPLKSA